MGSRYSLSTASERRPPEWQVPRRERRENSDETLSENISQVHTNPSSMRVTKWWKIWMFRGIVKDIRRRAPYYWSDWLDAWDYRVIPATVYMYFVSLQECRG